MIIPPGQVGPSPKGTRNAPKINKPIVLIGMMGCGKTTIGRHLARVLSVPFADADKEIELAAGITITDYFEKFGEVEFRRGEERVIKRLLSANPTDQVNPANPANPANPLVLATGGGAVISEMTRDLIKDKAVCIWLKSELKTLLARTAHKNTRPLLRQGDPAETLTRLMRERTPFYEKADIIIESDHMARNVITQHIIDRLTDYLD